jgi:hypothetical protein
MNNVFLICRLELKRLIHTYTLDASLRKNAYTFKLAIVNY